MSLLELSKGLGILLLGLEEVFVPLLIELLVLLYVSLFTLLSLLGLTEDKLFISSVIVLNSELSDSVFSHLCLDVVTLLFASLSVLLKGFTKIK